MTENNQPRRGQSGSPDVPVATAREGTARPVRVLHVEDDPDFADLATKALERTREHFEVESAGRVDEALERMAREQFDCVVSDFDMPGANGLEFLESVRQ